MGKVARILSQKVRITSDAKKTNMTLAWFIIWNDRSTTLLHENHVKKAEKQDEMIRREHEQIGLEG